MEFKRIERRAYQGQAVEERYPTDLQMYIDIPTDVIDVDEFQQLAVERVKLLRVLETIAVRNAKDISIKDQVVEEMQKQGVKYFLPVVQGYPDLEARRRDYLSHYILRLAYCRSEEYRRWFLARELEFFKLKFYNIETREEVMLFMKNSYIPSQPISDEEKDELAAELIASTRRNISFDQCTFYKVPFTQVPDLVCSRKVLVRRGFAYVPFHDLISILSSIYRATLSHFLSTFAPHLPTLEGDERLARILHGLLTSNTGVKKDKNCVPYSAIDGLSKISFPPCMRSLYETFEKTHDLRNTGRQHLGLFLKSIGVSLEDSLRFWREGFTQTSGIDVDIFEKRYACHIRHNYGMEGKRANYTPPCCMKIITTSVGVGENHGCPFRHCDPTSLRSRLQAFGLSVKDVGDVAELAARGHCQLACTRYFEITHNVQNAGINAPNQFFADSQTVLGGTTAKNRQSTTPTGQRATQQPMQTSADDWGDDSIDNALLNVVLDSESMIVE